jgi:uncharacterized protein (UPF0548 family)
MSDWRIGRSWTEGELEQYLASLNERPVNFETPVEEMIPEHGWTVDGSHDQIGTEAAGPPEPDGAFERARQGIINYDFSDPRIVEGHFDPKVPLVGRDMVLEIKAFGIMRFLGGVRVHSVREECTDDQSLFGYRYDTLRGHIERGYEWFLLTKDHRTGEVWFQIEAHWRLGDFPTWWSRVGFKLFGENFRRLWRHEAPLRLKQLTRKEPQEQIAAPGRLAHRGDPTPRPTEPVRRT